MRGMLCVLIEPNFKTGDQPPTGYLEWHSWATVQARAGLKQRRCPTCRLWRFPQEPCLNGKCSQWVDQRPEGLI